MEGVIDPSRAEGPNFPESTGSSEKSPCRGGPVRSASMARQMRPAFRSSLVSARRALTNSGRARSLAKSAATLGRRDAEEVGARERHRVVHRRLRRAGHPASAVVDHDPRDVACRRRIGFAAGNRFGSSPLFATKGDPIGAGSTSAPRAEASAAGGQRRSALGNFNLRRRSCVPGEHGVTGKERAAACCRKKSAGGAQ